MNVKELYFYERPRADNDILYVAYYEGYKITVLNRMTGYGHGLRDTETGLADYRIDSKDNFWLASGMFDIRDYPELSMQEAIIKIKENANTVIPKGDAK